MSAAAAMTLRDALVALEKTLEDWSDDMKDGAYAALSERIEAMRAALDAAWPGIVADAGRYAFLRDVGPPDAETGYPKILQWKLVTSERGSGRLLFGKDLDAAIDAAIAMEASRG